MNVILGLTATAPEATLEDVATRLGVKSDNYLIFPLPESILFFCILRSATQLESFVVHCYQRT